MILAFDTYYIEQKAKTVCLSFRSWDDEEIISSEIEIKDKIDNYISGEFYKRELPCILSLLKRYRLDQIDCIIIDGYVFLDDDNKLGLGGYLYESLGRVIPVVGVAKSNFATIHQNKRIVLRGSSKKPIYVTSAGLTVDEAASRIVNMKGEFRMPTILKQLDVLTKESSF